MDDLEPSKTRRVALRKESVDRNSEINARGCKKMESLSARRAWIEMLAPRLVDMSNAVALRKESVDRNKYVVQCRKTFGVSLSARRAWIEIMSELQPLIASLGRSPQGERG